MCRLRRPARICGPATPRWPAGPPCWCLPGSSPRSLGCDGGSRDRDLVTGHAFRACAGAIGLVAGRGERRGGVFAGGGDGVLAQRARLERRPDAVALAATPAG